MKRPKWLGDWRATKSDKLKKAWQQTDQRMNVQKKQLDETGKKNALLRTVGPSERFYSVVD